MNLKLYVGDPTVDLYTTYSSGIFVSIHNKSIAPFTRGDVIKVGTGSDTDIIVNRNFISKLPARYGNCLDDTTSSSTFSSTYFDYIVRNKGYNYSQEHCFQLCIQQQTINYCGCANVWIPSFDNSSLKYCTATEVDCAITVVKVYGNNFTDQCNSACPFECYSIDYSVTTHRNLYPTSVEQYGIYNQIVTGGKNISYDSIPESFLKVCIYYHSMQYTQTLQIASMQTSDLMSNFGGTLGLFLGLSLLSFVEAVDILFKLFQILITQNKKQGNKINEFQTAKMNDNSLMIEKPEIFAKNEMFSLPITNLTLQEPNIND